MRCIHCKKEITPGEMWLRGGPSSKSSSNGFVRTFMGPAHLSCPTQRQIRQREWKERARAALARASSPSGSVSS